MSTQEIKRVNFFDGQNLTEEDMDTEQSAWTTTASSNMDTVVGSGIKKEFTTQRVLFDLNDVPSTTAALLTGPTFDGEPIYPTDSFGATVYLQPSDTVEGNQLEIEISGASLTGAPKLKVFLFGLTLNDAFVYEVLEFENNGSKITRTYFTSLIAFMTQDFRGNGNTIIDGTACRNVGGNLRIMESLPFTVITDHIMAEQAEMPNMDFVNFKPAAPAKTLDIVLAEIANTDNQDEDDLEINIGSTTTRQLPKNTVGLIIGEKFKATTNNVQKISILLSVEEDSTAAAGHEYDWSGDIVVGIRALQKTVSCPLNTIPNTGIEYDPQPSVLAEVAFDQDELADLGIILTNTTQVVDFVFTQSLLANPNVAPSLTPGDYYILTVTRSGDISQGNIILEEAANTNADPGETDEMRMAVFSGNEWTDIEDSDMWFKIYTSAIRITNGTAFDGGYSITSPKSTINEITGTDESYIDGHYSLLDVSSTADNYVILQRENKFSDAVSHPSTGNSVYSRIQDYPNVTIVNEDTLADLVAAGNETVILGSVTDINPTGTDPIIGNTEFPGLAGTTTFAIIQPSADITTGNLIGAILVPNTTKETLKYKIVAVDVYTDAYGDINNDGVIDAVDVLAAQDLDGYAPNLTSGTIPAAAQLTALIAGVFTVPELIRADVNNDGQINALDAQLIQQHVSLGTAFDAGSSFTRAVITVESLTDPLTTTPNILGSDADFNDVPFTAIPYRIDFISLWSPENLIITDLRRYIPQTFTALEETDITGTAKSGGTNSFYIPGDLILGGDILDESEEAYNFDFEINTITIDLPEGPIAGEFNLFNTYIKSTMKFYDGTLVGSSALTDNQVKVTVAIQSITKDRDGYDQQNIDSDSAIDESISILYVPTSGLLRIRSDNLRHVDTRAELRTKLIITVYLKKAGFQNADASIDESTFTGLLSAL
jgi:hypothetical protein